MKARKGFSLLELLIVVAIILIIATIAIPSMLRSRQSANESVAVSNLRNLNSAQATYSSANFGIYTDIPTLIAGGLIDLRYNSGNFSGYQYSLTLTPDLRNYTAVASAVSATTARYDYYTLPNFVIHYSTAATRAPAGRAGQPVN
jgi:prepilin-type N-terminal cleavage/methylation domain-containing protein